MRAGIAFGSNLGDRLANLKTARAEVTALPKVEAPILASTIYETEPVDFESDAGRFFNAVIEVGYAGDANELLRALRAIEAAHGRSPAHARNTSRTLDLDLLYFGDLPLTTAELKLPHPRMQTRRFVLEPLVEIRPDLLLPGQEENVTALLAQLPESAPLVRVTSQW